MITFFAVCTLLFGTVQAIFLEEDNAPTNGTAIQLSAAIFDLGTTVFLCNGVMYSQVYMSTSCRCLFRAQYVFLKNMVDFSGIGASPYYVKRDAVRYGLVPTSLISNKNDEFRYYKIQYFIVHPLCLKLPIPKPYHNHFGLAVLQGEGIADHRLLLPIKRPTAEDKIRPGTMCHIRGLQGVDSGMVMAETSVVLMPSEDCLWRLCVPKTRCFGRENNVQYGQEMCLRTVDDRKLEGRLYEGSEVMCNGKHLGLIVSTGRIRYPHAPVVSGSIAQFIDNLNLGVKSQLKSRGRKTSVANTGENAILALALLVVSDRRE